MFDSRKGEGTSQPTGRRKRRRRSRREGSSGEMGRVWTEKEGMGKTVRGMKNHFWGKGGKGGREKGLPSDGGEMSSRKQMTQGKRGSG